MEISPSNFQCQHPEPTEDEIIAIAAMLLLKNTLTASPTIINYTSDNNETTS